MSAMLISGGAGFRGGVVNVLHFLPVLAGNHTGRVMPASWRLTLRLVLLRH